MPLAADLSLCLIIRKINRRYKSILNRRGRFLRGHRFLPMQALSPRYRGVSVINHTRVSVCVRVRFAIGVASCNCRYY